MDKLKRLRQEFQQQQQQQQAVGSSSAGGSLYSLPSSSSQLGIYPFSNRSASAAEGCNLPPPLSQGTRASSLHAPVTAGDWVASPFPALPGSPAAGPGPPPSLQEGPTSAGMQLHAAALRAPAPAQRAASSSSSLVLPHRLSHNASAATADPTQTSPGRGEEGEAEADLPPALQPRTYEPQSSVSVPLC